MKILKIKYDGGSIKGDSIYRNGCYIGKSNGSIYLQNKTDVEHIRVGDKLESVYSDTNKTDADRILLKYIGNKAFHVNGSNLTTGYVNVESPNNAINDSVLYKDGLIKTYNDINVGLSDFTIEMWHVPIVTLSKNYGSVFQLIGTNSLYIARNQLNNYWYSQINESTSLSSNNELQSYKLYHFCIQRKNNVFYSYQNGKLLSSVESVVDFGKCSFQIGGKEIYTAGGLIFGESIKIGFNKYDTTQQTITPTYSKFEKPYSFNQQTVQKINFPFIKSVSNESDIIPININNKILTSNFIMQSECVFLKECQQWTRFFQFNQSISNNSITFLRNGKTNNTTFTTFRLQVFTNSKSFFESPEIKIQLYEKVKIKIQRINNIISCTINDSETYNIDIGSELLTLDINTINVANGKDEYNTQRIMDDCLIYNMDIQFNDNILEERFYPIKYKSDYTPYTDNPSMNVVANNDKIQYIRNNNIYKEINKSYAYVHQLYNKNIIYTMFDINEVMWTTSNDMKYYNNKIELQSSKSFEHTTSKDTIYKITYVDGFVETLRIKSINSDTPHIYKNKLLELKGNYTYYTNDDINIINKIDDEELKTTNYQFIGSFDDKLIMSDKIDLSYVYKIIDIKNDNIKSYVNNISSDKYENLIVLSIKGKNIPKLSNIKIINQNTYEYGILTLNLYILEVIDPNLEYSISFDSNTYISMNNIIINDYYTTKPLNLSKKITLNCVSVPNSKKYINNEGTLLMYNKESENIDVIGPELTINIFNKIKHGLLN